MGCLSELTELSDRHLVARAAGENAGYNYYKGPFKNGHPAHSGNDGRVYFDEAISEEEKNYIISDKPFSNIGIWEKDVFD